MPFSLHSVQATIGHDLPALEIADNANISYKRNFAEEVGNPESKQLLLYSDFTSLLSVSGCPDKYTRIFCCNNQLHRQFLDMNMVNSYAIDMTDAQKLRVSKAPVNHDEPTCKTVARIVTNTRIYVSFVQSVVSAITYRANSTSKHKRPQR